MDSTDPMKQGLLGVTHKILLENMVQHAVGSADFLAMVTDAEGRRVLAASFKMSELAQEGVTHVEDLCQPRQPQVDLGAIYFIGPSESSIDRLLFDFREDLAEPMYAAAWVFFTGSIPDDQFRKLQGAGLRFKRALKCCRELLLEFTPLPTLGGRGFTLGVPELTRDLYSSQPEPTPAQDRTVDRLFQLCISLGEAPEIAYFGLDDGSRGSRVDDAVAGTTKIAMELIAIKLDEKLRKFKDGSPGQKDYMKSMSKAKNAFLPKASANRDTRPLLVLLDRSVDPAGPLVHDLSYEGACHDMLDVDLYGGIPYSAGRQILDTADLTDDIWEQFRETHYAVRGQRGDPPGLGPAIKQRFDKFTAEFAFMDTSGAPATTASALDRRKEKDRVGRLKEYQKKHRLWGAHINVVESLAKIIEERQLLPKSDEEPGLCTIESDLIMTRDQFEDDLSAKELTKRCQTQLEQLRKDEDKMRLLALYWFCLGVREGGGGEMDKLVAAAFPGELSPTNEAIIMQLKEGKFCSNLDVKSEKHGTGSKRMICYGYADGHRRRHTTEADGQERNPFNKQHGETTIEFEDQVSRYRPSLYWLLKDFAKGGANAYKKHWKGLTAGGQAQSNYVLQEAIKWSDYGNDDSERVQKLKEMGVSEPGLDRSSRKTGPRMIIICVLGGVTYAEIHQAAEIERRTGCTVLIGGSEVLTPSAYLERLSMQGEWTEPQQDVFDPVRAAGLAKRSDEGADAEGEGAGAAGQPQASEGACLTKCITLCGMMPLDKPAAASTAQP